MFEVSTTYPVSPLVLGQWQLFCAWRDISSFTTCVKLVGDSYAIQMNIRLTIMGLDMLVRQVAPGSNFCFMSGAQCQYDTKLASSL